MDKTKCADSFSIRRVLEEAGIVIMLIVQQCKLLERNICKAGTEVIDDRGCWSNVFIHLVLVIGLPKTFQTC